jgi:hypothetical protein
MLLSAVSVSVIVLQSPEIPEGLMNNPVYNVNKCVYIFYILNMLETIFKKHQKQTKTVHQS